MPPRLPISTTKWTGRLRSEDLELLTQLFPGRVNEIVRALVQAGCEGLLRHAGGTSPRGQG